MCYYYVRDIDSIWISRDYVIAYDIIHFLLHYVSIIVELNNVTRIASLANIMIEKKKMSFIIIS